MRGRNLALAFLMLALPVGSAQASWRGLFDVEKRRAELASTQSRSARESCLAIRRNPAWANLEPVTGLRQTDGYGTDQTSQQFAWAVMVLSGRALAGEIDSRTDLSKLLVNWAKAGAFRDTEVVHDAYYALKRTLLPTIVAYQVVQPALPPRDAEMVKAWIDGLVRRIDKRFDGDVDRNNHRILADSVLALWGSVIGDDDLYKLGRKGFDAAVAHARADGSLPLETRRGARAGWYTRQALADLTLIAEVAAGRGENLYAGIAGEGDRKGVPLTRLAGYFANVLIEPAVALPYAAENYIPGPNEDFADQDLGYLTRRPTGRHYLAFLEAFAARSPEQLPYARLTRYFEAKVSLERPLVDEFIGGNATCFWRRS